MFQHVQELLGAFFKTINAVFNGEQEKEKVICVRMGWKNPSLMMPNCDPQDEFFHPTLTLVIDSYIILYRELITKVLTRLLV